MALAANELERQLVVLLSRDGGASPEDADYYKDLVENANDIVYTHNLRGDFTAVNRAIQRITGYSREEALKLKMTDLLTAESAQLFHTMLGRMLGDGSRAVYEVTAKAKDGRSVVLELSVRLLFETGQPVGVLGIARDVSERKRSEAHLHLLKSVVVNANDAVLVAEIKREDPLGGRIVYVNEAFTRMTGYSSEESVGRTPRILLGPRTDRSQLNQVRKALLNSLPVRVELVNYCMDGSAYWVDVNFVPIADDSGEFTHWVAVQRETTYRRRAEDLERDRNQVLELVAKNEPLEVVMSHLAQMVERQCPELLCSVLLLRNGRLHTVAAPSLKDSLMREYDVSEIILRADSSEPSADSDPPEESVVSPAGTELRRDWRVPDDAKQRPDWSVPIFSASGAVLGAFVVQFRPAKRLPTDLELDLLGKASRLAAIAIEQRQLTDQLAHQAQHDALTGLPNRVLFTKKLQTALTHARERGWHLAVLFVDLDRFKQINDSLGHSVGDVLLQQVARRLESCVRKTDTLARMGGDEFTLLLTELTDQQYALQVSRKLLDALKVPFHVDEYELFITASVGISVYPRDGRDAATLQRNADSAMYRAKNQGKDNFQVSAPELNATALESLEIENALRKAQENDELQVRYQPQVDLDGKLTALEALLVWNHPKLGVIPPSQFIPVAEETGLILPIGDWVLREACQQVAAWKDAGLDIVKVAVNVSAVQFAREGFVETVSDVLAELGLDPQLLELELTESAVMRDVEESARQMGRLRTLGVGLSIDDFGTGYSSLSYLRLLPIDTLKIDQSFLGGIDKEPTTMPLVKAIVTLAHSLQLCVVAEGVETKSQLEALRLVDCDRVQGYLFSGALPATSVGQLLSQPNSARPNLKMRVSAATG